MKAQPKSLLLTPFLIGSSAGSFAVILARPFYNFLQTFQSRRTSSSNIFKTSPVQGIPKNTNVSNISFKNLFKGLSAALTNQIIFCGLRLGIYRSIEDQTKKELHRHFTFKEKLKYSLLSGVVSSTMAVLTDQLLFRYQQNKKIKRTTQKYKNVYDTFKRIIKQQGFRSLYKGCLPTISNAIIFNMAQIVPYCSSKQFIQKQLNMQSQTTFIRFLSSAFTGFIITFFTNPFFSIRQRLSSIKPNEKGIMPFTSFTDCLLKSIKSEGLKVLWKGISFHYLRVAPAAMITMNTQDYLHDYFVKI